MADTKPDPKLLSLLEKLNNPISQLDLKIEIKGVYSYPDEWRTTDDANPGLFTYQVKMLDVVFEGGKALPRELTDKEKREQEEQLAAKSKKATKKGDKEQISPEEQEQLQRQIEKEIEEEKRKQQILETLNPQDRFYFLAEDKYKTAYLRFENDTQTLQLQDEKEQAFEDMVYNEGGCWLYFIKLPTISEDEITKMKKTKPKNLNLAELQPVTYKAWCSLADFQEPGVNSTEQRCALEQVIEEGQDVPRFNLNKTYIKVIIGTDPPVTALIEEVTPVRQVYEQNEINLPKAPTRSDCLHKFRNDVLLAMQSLANEYSVVNSKENNDQKSKTSTTMTVQKKQELQKKKEVFLQEINSSGKYKLLKERLRKSITRICIDKFQKEGLYTGITKDDKDRLFAELYVFLMEDMQKTLGQFIHTARDDIHEDLVASYEQNLKERDRVFSNITKESLQDKYYRLANEYEILNIHDQVVKYYDNMINLNPSDHKNLYTYARYCLRMRDFKKAEQLIERAYKEEESTEYGLIRIFLFIRRERFKEAEQMTADLLKKEPINTFYNLLMSFILKAKGDQKQSDKYKRCTERIFMRTMGLLQTKSSNKLQPDPHQLPNLKQQMHEMQEMIKRAPVLTNEQLDHIQMELIDHFAKYNFMDLVEQGLSQIIDKTTNKITVLKAQIQIFKDNNQEALKILNKYLEANPKNYEVHLIKGTLCYQLEQYYEAEETFLRALKIKQSKPFSLYLRLGYMYLKRKSWEDAKMIFTKAIDITNNSSLSWLGLGIATLRMNEATLCEESLTQANIYEPFNGEVWGYSALLCLQQGKREQQAVQCIQRMEETEVNDLELLEELSDEFYRYQHYQLSKNLLLRIFKTAQQKNIKPPNIGQIQMKLGKVFINAQIEVFDNLKQFDMAKQYYIMAIQNLEGENEKAVVIDLLENLPNY